MKAFIEYLVSQIVDHPEDVSVTEEVLDEYTVQFHISAHAEDIGKIIGKGGKVISAIRNLAKVLAMKEHKQIRIDVA